MKVNVYTILLALALGSLLVAGGCQRGACGAGVKKCIGVTLLTREHVFYKDLEAGLREAAQKQGFGLTVTEAIWKGRPFIGGNVGGIPLQVENGVSGYLVDSVEACAYRTLDILRDPALGKALGRRGKEHVRKHFLTPRLLRDWLVIFQGLQ